MLTMATDAKHISINLYPIIYSGWLNTILNNLKLLVQNLGRESWSVLSSKYAKLSKGQGGRTHSPPMHFFKWRKLKERFQEEPSLFLIDVTRGVRGGELKKKKKKYSRGRGNAIRVGSRTGARIKWRVLEQESLLSQRLADWEVRRQTANNADYKRVLMH